MALLVEDGENFKTSAVYIGYLILKEVKKSETKKVSIYKVSDTLKKNGISHSRQLIFGLLFLYSLGIVKFEEPYLWIE
ncbi:hypothetical protein M2105_004816 [Paenibacillus sp. PastF-1]|nr:hypothetical protein [Paenibacillus sp. PastF-2]MDF9850357.1 hypothetical protein [Paenibacillus sp. PastM-2]MDF9856940.1 hypothetical protein [Paenibacillus sp. PastF-1]MDH6482203.1 hypothetical protein [Paenibacillus sp. PastH-2]MDH6509633.1 hypothetical protein [Paenibacillus sp. PastM-3]